MAGTLAQREGRILCKRIWMKAPPRTMVRSLKPSARKCCSQISCAL